MHAWYCFLLQMAATNRDAFCNSQCRTDLESIYTDCGFTIAASPLAGGKHIKNYCRLSPKYYREQGCMFEQLTELGNITIYTKNVVLSQQYLSFIH